MSASSARVGAGSRALPVWPLFALTSLSALAATGCLSILGADFDGAHLDSSGTGGGSACGPDLTQACYDGPAPTEGVGACRAGVRHCSADGLGFGECLGQVLPAASSCSADDADVDCDGRTAAHVYSRVFGGSGVQRTRAMALGGGRATLTGYAWGSMPLPEGELPPGLTIIQTLAADGKIAWGRSFGVPGTGAGLSIVADSNGGVVLTADISEPHDFGDGELAPVGNQDVVVGLDGLGNVVFSRFAGSQGADTEDAVLALESNGDVIVAGWFIGPLEWGGQADSLDSGTEMHLYVARLRPDAASKTATAEWARDVGRVNGVTRVALDANGDILVTGSVVGTTDFGGDPIGGGGETSSFVVRMTADGTHLWSHTLGTFTDKNFGRALALLPDGSVVVAVPVEGVEPVQGPADEDLDIEVVRFSKAGDVVWTRRFGGPGRDSPWDAAADPSDGSVVVVGAFKETLDAGDCDVVSGGDSDAFALKLDTADGHTLWVRSFGDQALDHPVDEGWPADIFYCVAVDPTDGSILVAGEFDGNVDFGGGVLFGEPANGETVLARYRR